MPGRAQPRGTVYNGVYRNPNGVIIPVSQLGANPDFDQIDNQQTEDTQDAAAANKNLAALEALRPDIQRLRGSIGQYRTSLEGAGQRLATYDPWAGLDKEIAAYRTQLQPGFDEQEQAIRERANTSGTFRGGQRIFNENRAMVGFEQQVASQLAQRATERSGLDLQHRTAANSAYLNATAAEGGALGMESDLDAGMTDYYQGKRNERARAAAQTQSNWLGFFGDAIKAGATVAAFA